MACFTSRRVQILTQKVAAGVMAIGEHLNERTTSARKRQYLYACTSSLHLVACTSKASKLRGEHLNERTTSARKRMCILNLLALLFPDTDAAHEWQEAHAPAARRV